MQEDEIKDFSFARRISGTSRIDWAKDDDVARPILLVDSALEGRKNLISGADKEDFHVKNITPGENFLPTAYADLRA